MVVARPRAKQTAVDGVTITRRDVRDDARRRELVRLLLKVLESPATPDEGR